MATKDLTSSQLYLWSYIQEHQEQISKMSIVQLSQQTNVSTATIVRTLQKMGYSGFTSFKDTLSHKSSHFEIFNQADDAIKEVINKNEIEMNNTLHNLDFSTIEKSIFLTKSAHLIYIFARGLSESIAEEIMVKLQLAGKYVEFHSDPNIITTMSKKIIHNNCLVVFVSLNGETLELVNAAKILSKNNINSITFTTNPSGTLLKYSSLAYIGYKSKTNYFPDYEVRSRLPLQIMARIFCDAYSVRSGFAKK